MPHVDLNKVEDFRANGDTIASARFLYLLNNGHTSKAAAGCFNGLRECIQSTPFAVTFNGAGYHLDIPTWIAQGDDYYIAAKLAAPNSTTTQTGSPATRPWIEYLVRGNHVWKPLQELLVVNDIDWINDRGGFVFDVLPSHLQALAYSLVLAQRFPRELPDNYALFGYLRQHLDFTHTIQSHLYSENLSLLQVLDLRDRAALWVSMNFIPIVEKGELKFVRAYPWSTLEGTDASSFHHFVLANTSQPTPFSPNSNSSMMKWLFCLAENTPERQRLTKLDEKLSSLFSFHKQGGMPELLRYVCAMMGE